MGRIYIATEGSFAMHEVAFSAKEHGHANAVAEAIEWLSKELLPESTALDHELHDQGLKPRCGWKRIT